MKWFGLRNKVSGQVMGFDASADNNADLSYHLEEYPREPNVWLVQDKKYAQDILDGLGSYLKRGFYTSANYNTPLCFSAKEFEIFEVEI